MDANCAGGVAMIFRRVAADLRAQNWVGVLIELVIVILGVFIAIQAANWNQERLERGETKLLMSQLDIELRDWSAYLDRLDNYYAITRKHARTAEAGWRGEPVGDEQFVIAAYQASQVIGVGNDSGVWAQIFGADDLRNIEDPKVRSNLARLMTFDYDTVSLESVSTPYREQVRKLIPDNLQNAIREHCGDRPTPDGVSFELPPRCTLDLPDRDAAETAAQLRANSNLRRELRWHQAAVANQLLNVGALRNLTKQIRTDF